MTKLVEPNVTATVMEELEVSRALFELYEGGIVGAPSLFESPRTESTVVHSPRTTVFGNVFILMAMDHLFNVDIDP